MKGKLWKKYLKKVMTLSTESYSVINSLIFTNMLSKFSFHFFKVITFSKKVSPKRKKSLLSSKKVL